MPLAKPRYTHQLPIAKAKFCGDISGADHVFLLVQQLTNSQKLKNAICPNLFVANIPN